MFGRIVLPALLVLALAGCRPGGQALPSSDPAEVGLAWRECEMPGEGMAAPWLASEACLGHPLPRVDGGDNDAQGADVAGGHELKIGSATYRTFSLESGYLPWQVYGLMRDGRAIRIYLGQFVVHSPDIGLRRVAGQPAWEYSDMQRTTVVYGGEDLSARYALEAAFRPYEVGGKLLFIGRKAGKDFVIYDGRRVGPEFDRITNGYCCETVMYSPRAGAGRYAFWGTRGDVQYVVEIEGRP